MKSEMDLKKLKSGGFIKQAKNDLFAIRLRVPVGDLEASKLRAVAKIAKQFGSGKIHLTVRQGIEINDVAFENFEKVTSALKKAELEFGACGPRVRVVTACPGIRVCPKGLGDTKALGKKLDNRFFGKPLPHKLKMAVTGCPNSCSKPQENDIGFMAAVQPALDESVAECISCGICQKKCPAQAIVLVNGKPKIDLTKCSNDGLCIQTCPTGSLIAKKSGWHVFVGGKFGRKPKLGFLFMKLVTSKEAIALTEKILMVFKQYGKNGERISQLIERTGRKRFKELVNGS